MKTQLAQLLGHHDAEYPASLLPAGLFVECQEHVLVMTPLASQADDAATETEEEEDDEETEEDDDEEFVFAIPEGGEDGDELIINIVPLEEGLAILSGEETPSGA